MVTASTAGSLEVEKMLKGSSGRLSEFRLVTDLCPSESEVWVGDFFYTAMSASSGLLGETHFPVTH